MLRRTLTRTVSVGVTLAMAAACSGGSDGRSLPTPNPPTTVVTTGVTTEITSEITSGITAAVTTDVAPKAPATSVPTPAGDSPSTTGTSEFIPAAFQVAAGTEQLTVSGASPGVTLTVYDGDTALLTGEADANGFWVARRLPGGAELVVRSPADEVAVAPQMSEPVVTLARDQHPRPAFYAEQRLPTDGMGYIATRDGTLLSATVWLPGPADAGPYPTVVEYSGYEPSNPGSTGFPEIWGALGYAYVGVNMRGTGCSGGSYRFFEYAQSLDGYDAIEAIAAQPWVQDHRVGMVGISYSGISQLFVAQTQPPSLAAITPLSVLADSYRSTLYPGGILNVGFAVEWMQSRMREAAPLGQPWTIEQIDSGDETCAANQDLRLQNPDMVQRIRDNPYWTDELGAELAPVMFADRVEVPTFIAGAWQDEQTGGHFATMLDAFTGTEHLYATLLNGLHTEAIGPAVLPRLVEFLDLYVARRVPALGAARAIAPIIGTTLFDTADVALPTDDRFAGLAFDDALAAFESEPPIRVLFEEGAAAGFPDRAPMARFEAAFDAWPVPAAVAAEWFLDGDGVLDDAPDTPNADGSTSTAYLALPDAIPPTFFEASGPGIWSVDAEFSWVEGGRGTFAAWVTPPLPTDIAIIGSGSADLWVKSNLGDTDLEVTISEVRPDGHEMYIQSGWLRASHRALDEAASSALRPVHTDRADDAAPLPDDEFALARVELFPVAHVLRAGSRLRLSIDAPGGNRAEWVFVTIAGGERVTIGHDAATPSKLVLPIVDLTAVGVTVPPQYPTCGALRGQPCRVFVDLG